MKRGLIITVLALAIALLTAMFIFPRLAGDEKPQKDLCYVGVAFCGNTTAEAELLIDRLKNYTNLFILQSGPVSTNETATNEICDYAISAGLRVIVYFGDLSPRALTNETMWRIAWINTTKERWGENFLGVYYYDEPGGLYLDANWSSSPFRSSPNLTYSMITESYIRGFNRDRGVVALKANSLPIFVSDYALYWFDYLAGYDVVLAQVGWNHSYPQDIALVRGAARLQGRQWGVMITWKYNSEPYLDTGENIFGQMLAAYKAGAKYIAVFNYPQLDGNYYGVFKEEHFDMLEKFWTEVVNTPGVGFGSTEVEAALVLPKDYGWGMRHPDDKIWGIWGPDERSPQIWELSRRLLLTYGFSLDIIYEDGSFPFEGKYPTIYYWNSSDLR